MLADQPALCQWRQGVCHPGPSVCRWEDIFDKGLEQKITELINVRYALHLLSV